MVTLHDMPSCPTMGRDQPDLRLVGVHAPDDNRYADHVGRSVHPVHPIPGLVVTVFTYPGYDAIPRDYRDVAARHGIGWVVVFCEKTPD